MNLPRKTLTVRALIVVIVLFAVDFGGIAWVVRQQRLGPRVGDQVLREDVWIQADWRLEILAPIVFFGPILLLFALIYLYVPPRLDEVLAVILILILLLLILVPALKHS